jgi:SAM-dependent methyltransferase
VRPRVRCGRFLIRLGAFVRSLAIMVMRPDDLVEFGRLSYATSQSVEAWGHQDLVDSALKPAETALVEKVPTREGRLLVLGVGGGREAIPLARMGFKVTGVDFVPGMVERAKQNAARRSVGIKGMVQEISRLEVPAGSYDVVWLCAAMYSCVPTRERRLAMLKTIRRALTRGGYFVCQFHWGLRGGFSRRAECVRKLFALLTLGDLWYEKGDMLWAEVEFIHAFTSENELRAEFEEGGFDVVHLDIPQTGIRGGAVLVKRDV